MRQHCRLLYLDCKCIYVTYMNWYIVDLMNCTCKFRLRVRILRVHLSCLANSTTNNSPIAIMDNSYRNCLYAWILHWICIANAPRTCHQSMLSRAQLLGVEAAGAASSWQRSCKGEEPDKLTGPIFTVIRQGTHAECSTTSSWCEGSASIQTLGWTLNWRSQSNDAVISPPQTCPDALSHPANGAD